MCWSNYLIINLKFLKYLRKTRLLITSKITTWPIYSMILITSFNLIIIHNRFLCNIIMSVTGKAVIKILQDIQRNIIIY